MKRYCECIPGPRGRGAFFGAAAIAVLGALLTGCPSPIYDASVLQHAAELGEAQHWDEARPLIRAHLLKFPDDPIGHYYYGLSFLHLAEPQLTYAEGELLTAQALLERNQSIPKSALEADLNVFKGKICQKTALVYMRAFRESVRLNVPYELSRGLLKKALAQTELGLQADPASPWLKEYLEFLKETLGGMPENVPEIMTRAAETGTSI